MMPRDDSAYLSRVASDFVEQLRALVPPERRDRDFDRIDYLACQMVACVEDATRRPTIQRLRLAQRRTTACAAVLATSAFPSELRQRFLATLHHQLSVIGGIIAGLEPPDTVH
jgi:hypothetical protein